mmetsp:Transcript_42483/g.83054  ORF Transcript_42483/g.83054 Transcript_42483/m.83054 type:complete len:202 (-) Transcript_42483:434-1039(-)
MKYKVISHHSRGHHRKKLLLKQVLHREEVRGVALNHRKQHSTKHLKQVLLEQILHREELRGLILNHRLQQRVVAELGSHHTANRHDAKSILDRQSARGRGLATGEGEGVGAALALAVDVDASNTVCHNIDKRPKLLNIPLSEDGCLLTKGRTCDIVHHLLDVVETPDGHEGPKLLLVPHLHVRGDGVDDRGKHHRVTPTRL